MSKSRLLTVVGIGVLSSSAAFAAPPTWVVDQKTSNLTFETKQDTRAITGKFAEFTPTIVFDSKDLPASKIAVTIKTGSAITGDNTNDSALPGKDWFNIETFPTATFESTNITAKAPMTDGTENYEAKGKLTILGVSHDVVLPFTLQKVGDNTQAKGYLTIKRLDYGIGSNVDPNGTMVENDVAVRFDIIAHPPTAK